jgi:hypothetical protein
MAMQCSQYQELLSNYIDGSLDLGEQAKVEGHLAACDNCRATRDDLLQIVVFSRHLPPHDPSPAIWSRVRSEIEAEPSFRVATWWSKLTSLHHSPFRFATALIVFLVIVSAALLLMRTGGLRQPNLLPSEAAIAPLANAEAGSGLQELETRIKALNADLESRRDKWDPDFRTVFDRNMLYVDETLARCHHELSHNPGDEIARDMMMGAYREKVRLLEGFTDF